MAHLRETLCQVMTGYTGKGFNDTSYLTWNEAQDVFAVVSIGRWHGEHMADSGLIVRLIEDKIVIERDMHDKTLLDALLQAGVPRAQIVLAYAGETLQKTPEPAIE